MQWTKSNGDIVEIRKLMFALPKHAEEGKSTKGFYIIFQADNTSVNEGVYSYYYNNELFNALSDAGNTVTSGYRDTPTEFDLQYYSNITNEEMKSAFINTYGWTHLTDHSLYMNTLSKQVVVNFVFSKKASEKELNAAREYWKVIETYESYHRSNPDIYTIWSRVPENAEITVQVFAEDELVSQDIYGEIENGVIYTEIHYEENIFR